MKIWCTFLLFFIFQFAFGQFRFEGRFRLEKVIFQGVEYFDRTKGPAKSDSKISVTFATPDESFNEAMNKKPFDYFSRSEFTFLEDSMFVRVGTTAQGGVYRNETQFGNFRIETDTNLVAFFQTVPGPQLNVFSYFLHGDTAFTIDSNNGLIATYTKHPDKFENPLTEPWQTYNVPIILDAYYQNDIPWNELLQDQKVTAIIHKAGQGLTLDSKYDMRKYEAEKRNYLWGSYWLGTDDDPVAQAEMYYKLTKGDTTELCCLDLEDVNAKGNMKLKDAEKFINRWYELSGKYPALYCNKNVLAEIEKKYDKTSVFAKCPLWYARFKKDITDFNSTVWDHYTLWQFSSEINCEKKGECLYNVPGCAHDMDINVYYGSITELRGRWPNL